MRGGELSLSGALLENLEVLVFDHKAGRIAARIMADLMRRGEPLDVRDVFIAAIAMREGEKIATRDKGFRRVEELEVELW